MMTTHVDTKKSRRRIHEDGLKIWGINKTATGQRTAPNVRLDPKLTLLVIHSPMLDEYDSDDGLRGGVGRKMGVTGK
jgi:hypothetical protein